MGRRAAIALGFQNKKYFISCFVLLCFTLNISDSGFSKFTIIVLISAGRVGDKNTKPIPTPLWGAGTKYCPIPALAPLQGGENSHGAEWGGMGQSGARQNFHPQQVDLLRQFKVDAFKTAAIDTLLWRFKKLPQQVELVFYFILFVLFCKQPILAVLKPLLQDSLFRISILSVLKPPQQVLKLVFLFLFFLKFFKITYSDSLKSPLQVSSYLISIPVVLKPLLLTSLFRIPILAVLKPLLQDSSFRIPILAVLKPPLQVLKLVFLFYFIFLLQIGRAHV